MVCPSFMPGNTRAPRLYSLTATWPALAEDVNAPAWTYSAVTAGTGSSITLPSGISARTIAAGCATGLGKLATGFRGATAAPETGGCSFAMTRATGAAGTAIAISGGVSCDGGAGPGP